MARIVKLGELLPEDIAFEMPDGSQILAPGDPPLQLILKIASLFERAENTEEADNPNLGVEVLTELDAEVLGLLRMRDPDLTESPFGIIAIQHVVGALLEAYGFGVEGGEADPPPAPARSRKPKSPPSSGSRRSSTSSTSRRTTG